MGVAGPAAGVSALRTRLLMPPARAPATTCAARVAALPELLLALLVPSVACRGRTACAVAFPGAAAVAVRLMVPKDESVTIHFMRP